MSPCWWGRNGGNVWRILEGLLIRDHHSVLPSLKSWSIIEICKVEIIKCSLISQKDEGTWPRRVGDVFPGRSVAQVMCKGGASLDNRHLAREKKLRDPKSTWLSHCGHQAWECKRKPLYQDIQLIMKGGDCHLAQGKKSTLLRDWAIQNQLYWVIVEAASTPASWKPKTFF